MKSKILSVLLITIIMVGLLPTLTITTQAAEKDWLWPVLSNKTIMQPFHSGHSGIDISMGTAYDVVAVKSGTVVVAKYNACYHFSKLCKCASGFGNYIVIDHGTSEGDKRYSAYVHLEPDFKIRKNDPVKQGQVIAKTGSSGSSNGRHLHFAFSKNISSNGIPTNYTNSNPSNSTNIKAYAYATSGYTNADICKGGNTDYIVTNPIKTFTIKYNANGGSGTMADTSVTNGVNTATRANSFTKTGHTFNTWFVQRHSDGKWRYRNPNNTLNTGWYAESKQPSGWVKFPYSNRGNVSATVGAGDTVTFYAQWKANIYTVTYNANGGTGTTANSTHIYGIAKKLTSNGFKYEGNKFLGWSTEKNAKTAKYTNNQSVTNLTATNNGTVTLYAVWKEDASIIICEHKNTEWKTISEPECIYKGITVKYCLDCGEPLESELLPALGHDWSEWTVLIPPDFDDEGQEERCCSHCTEIETQEIPILIESRKKGFITNNGENADISINDAIEIFKHLAGKNTLEGEDAFAADIDGKNGITINDAIYIFKYLAGKITMDELQEIHLIEQLII